MTPASYFDDVPGRLGFGIAVKRIIASKTVRLEIPLIAGEMFCRMRSSLGRVSSFSTFKPLTSARRARSQLEKAYPSIVSVALRVVIWYQ